METYQLLRIFIVAITLLQSQVTYSDTTITTTHDDNTSTITTIPDVGPDSITTVITPSILSSSTKTIVNGDGSTSSVTVTDHVTPGVDTPSSTTITTNDE